MIAVIGDSEQVASIALHRAAGFQTVGDLRGGRLQIRPVARYGADAMPIGPGSYDTTVVFNPPSREKWRAKGNPALRPADRIKNLENNELARHEAERTIDRP